MAMQPSRRRGKASAGFTLIELLVVIAIIAILAAILFPVTLIAMPIYAIVEMNDWGLLAVLAATVIVTGMLRAAKRNFERSA